MTRYAFWICALVVAVMTAASLWALDVVPADTRVAVHFGIDGEPDRFAGPVFAFWVLPVTAAVALVLFALVPRLSAATQIPEASRPAYSVFAIAITLVLAAAHGLIIAKAVGLDVSVTRWIAGVLGAMFLVTGNYATRIRPNAVFGVRLPWTLSDPRVWARTHRLYGWLSVLFGIVLLTLALSGAPDPVIAGSILAGLAALVLGVVIHSWWIARPASGALR